jgi:hypothetical protein
MSKRTRHDREEEAEEEDAIRAAAQCDQHCIGGDVSPIGPVSDPPCNISGAPDKPADGRAVKGIQDEGCVGNMYKTIRLDGIKPDYKQP